MGGKHPDLYIRWQIEWEIAKWVFTSLLPAEPNRRLLAFYNICAEYKKAIFQVFKPKPWLNNETTFFRERKQRRI